MPDRDGFEIYKRFYPMPTRFRLGDPVLVREVTGMSWPDFIAAMQQMEADDEVDQVALFGLMAVAFWQGNPQMSRSKVRQVLERVWQEDAEMVVADETSASEAEESDAGPPAEGGATPPSPPSESNNAPDTNSEPLIQSNSGSLGSPTGSPA